MRRCIHNGSSQAAACRSLNVHEKQVIEWKKQFKTLKDSSNKKAKSLCKGRSSILFPLTDPLLSFIFELHESSQAAACRSLNVHEKQVIEWKKQFKTLKDSSNKKAKSLCKGRSSILFPLTDPLLSFIFELHETGMAVSITMIVLKAAQLSQPFCEKSSQAQYHIVNRFVKSHGMVHRMGTHVAQKAPSESMGDALDFPEVNNRVFL